MLPPLAYLDLESDDAANAGELESGAYFPEGFEFAVLVYLLALI